MSTQIKIIMDTKRGRGKPRDYATIKTSKGINITDVAWDGLKVLSASFGLSRAELIERLGRGMLSPSEFQEVYKKFLEKA
jgi:hypothetical protein